MIVVTGATGNVGRLLMAELTAAGERVVGVSRRGAAGVQKGDLTAPESLRATMQGARALFVLLAGGGEAVDADAVLDVAKAGGVERVVLLSSQGVRTRPGARSHAPLGAFEAALRGSGLQWTVLRPGGFASNAYAWAGSIRERRQAAAPFAQVALPVVDPADLAACASVTLRDNHQAQVYELTGPAPITPRAQVEAIAAAIGEPVAFRELTRAEAAEQMSRFMPAEVVRGTLDILGSPSADEQRVSPDVARLLGRPARDFAAWATEHAAAFR